jgi:hypothetical protein
MGLPDEESLVRELANGTDVIVLGRVEERTIREWLENDNRALEIRGKIKVIEVLKGSVDESHIWLETGPPTCNASFSVGDTYLFFARSTNQSPLPVTSLCSSFKYEYAQPGDPRNNRKLQARIDPVLEILRQL